MSADTSSSTPSSSSSDSTPRTRLPIDVPLPPPGSAPIYEQPAAPGFFVGVANSVTHMAHIPCARNSLLSGIASGVGIGLVRGMSAGPMVAGNWGVTTFMLVSAGTWHLCQNQLENERRRVQQVVEQMPQRLAKQRAEGEAKPPAAGTA